MIICNICGRETPITYDVTVRGYEDKNICNECVNKIEAESVFTPARGES